MLELRPFTEEDCDRLIGWIPDARFLMLWAGPGYSWPLDRKQLLATLERTRGYRPAYFMFKAVESDTGATIGHIELQRCDRSSGHIGRVLVGDPGCHGKGYGKRLVSLIIRFAFIDLGLDLLTLSVYDFNIAAVECYKRLGFRQVEFREKVRQCGDEFWNLIIMELRKEESQGVCP